MGLDEPRAADHSFGFISIASPFKEVNQELKGILEPLGDCVSDETIIYEEEG